MSKELRIQYLKLVLRELTKLSNELYTDAVSDLGRSIIITESDAITDFIKARIEELT